MHGGDIYSFQNETGQMPLDFSENTNPFMLPEGVKKAIIAGIEQYNVYPDPECRNLKNAVSQYYNIKEEQLVFGNGAADLIFKIAYGLRPKCALILAPTFSEYELALQKVDTKVEYFCLKEEEQFAVTEEILTRIPGHDIVYICNPNNPTGKVCSKALMQKIAQTCKENQAYLVVDECFMDFVPEWNHYSLLEEVEKYDNIIILKAFTKIFAMAGLRLGFGVSSNQSLLHGIQNAGQPWSVSTVAQVAGIACCKEDAYVKESLADIQKEKQYVKEALENLGFFVYESDANYLLLKSELDLAEALKCKGIMVRPCGNYHNLTKEYFRIGIKRRGENQKLVKALQEIR